MVGTQLPQTMVAVKDPDTIIHGAHEFRRVYNARRVLKTYSDGMEMWACGECGRWVSESWSYCPYCGRRLQNPEEDDRA